jgi:hypothetical protein
MTKSDYINLFAPAVAALVLALAGLLAAFLSGLTGKLTAYFTTHNEAALAQAAASANTVIQSALATGAATIAGKISRGELDYTNRAAIQAEAVREVGLVQARVPAMLTAAQPVAGALVASLMSKVDAMVVASPTLPSTPVVNAPAPAVTKAGT